MPANLDSVKTFWFIEKVLCAQLTSLYPCGKKDREISLVSLLIRKLIPS